MSYDMAPVEAVQTTSILEILVFGFGVADSRAGVDGSGGAGL
jgi:hypothetical protein